MERYARRNDRSLILCLPFPFSLFLQCSLSDIRAAYKHLSLTCHPDKIRSNVPVNGVKSPAQQREEAIARAEAQERWAKIEQAHELLSDPITRAMYDLDAGFVPNTEAEHARIARLKRKEAQIAVATMEETVAQNRAEEEKKGGLLILAARYGDLSASDLDQSSAVSAPYIDVSVPLQCMVHDSALILPEGRSKFWLEGFYDPSMGASPQENRLYIRYRFLGALHEAEFGDLEAVAIPVPEHCLENMNEEGEVDDSAAMGASSLSSSSSASSSRTSSRISSTHFATQSKRSAVAQARLKKRRRTMALATIILLGATVATMKYKGITLTSARTTIGDWVKELMKSFQSWTTPNRKTPTSQQTVTSSSTSSTQ